MDKTKTEQVRTLKRCDFCSKWAVWTDWEFFACLEHAPLRLSTVRRWWTIEAYERKCIEQERQEKAMTVGSV